MTTNESPSVERMIYHQNYCLRGGDITFLVEGTLFRVHRYFFQRDSSYFREQLPDGGIQEGTFRLDGISSKDFALFLWVFYNPKYSMYTATIEDWVTILKLADYWDFVEVKNLVARELGKKEEFGDVEKIALYHGCGVNRSFLFKSYAALCTRESMITLEEGKALGIETALNLCHARERIVRAHPTSTRIFRPEIVDEIIGEVFNLDSSSGLSRSQSKSVPRRPNMSASWHEQ